MKKKLSLLLAVALQGIAFAQAPVISYTTPNFYGVGNLIPALTPTNTGGAITYGNTTILAGSGSQGAADGNGASATFRSPVGAAVDASGNIYIADTGNHKIRKITPAGVVSTLAGSGSAGSANGTGTAASFNFPSGLTLDASGNIYVGDAANNKIRKITPSGVVSTFAGSGSKGSADGTGAAATFYNPEGLAVDASGNVYVADEGNHKIRKITPAGVVSTLAGSGTAGSADGTGTAASFYLPTGVALDASGNLYVADFNNNEIRMITPSGVVTTLAGSTTAGNVDGTGTAASFKNPFGVSVDTSGNIYVTDQGNALVRKIAPGAVVTTMAGIFTSTGTTTVINFNNPKGIAVDASGNVYIADFGNNMIRKIDAAGGFVVTPQLPAGLNIDAVAGAITGTPTAAISATTYTITATNRSGSGTTTVTISIGNAPVIAYTQLPLTFDSGTAIAPVSPDSVAGDPVITFSVAPDLPLGLSIDPTTGIISGTSTYGALESIYVVTATNSFGTSTANLDITVNGTLGVQDLAFKNMLVYPNPTNGEVNISNVMTEKVSVYNSLGQLVTTTTNQEAANATTVQLNNLPTGIYYMNIEAGNTSTVKQIIKQ